jgi:hypothetical protein
MKRKAGSPAAKWHGDHDVLNEFGEARILPKPYPEEDLVNRVGAALNRHKPLPE